MEGTGRVTTCTQWGMAGGLHPARPHNQGGLPAAQRLPQSRTHTPWVTRERR